MLRRLLLAAAIVSLPAAAFAAGTLCAPQNEIPTKAVSWEEAKKSAGGFGEMRTYFTGDTYGTRGVLVAVFEVKPGQAVHEAHRHADEEYMMLTEGSGTWHIEGKDSPAKLNDVVYCAPWTSHGLRNTGDKPLKFLVIKWHNKGMALPKKPQD